MSVKSAKWTAVSPACHFASSEVPGNFSNRNSIIRVCAGNSSVIVIKPLDPTSDAANRMIGQLDAYLQGLYPPESNHLDSTEELSRPHVQFIGALDDGEWRACGAVKLMTEGYGEIKRIYVDPAARGKGLARRVLDALEEIVGNAGLSVVKLETGVHQVEALRLFQNCGYRRIGPYGSYPDDPLSVFMEKQLTETTNI